MLQKDRFVEDCKAAVADGQKAIRGLVRKAVADPSDVIAGLGEPNQAGVYPPYHADNLTVINFTVATYMTLLSHNHHIFAVIGIFGGREDNIFWRRISKKRWPPHWKLLAPNLWGRDRWPPWDRKFSIPWPIRSAN